MALRSRRRDDPGPKSLLINFEVIVLLHMNEQVFIFCFYLIWPYKYSYERCFKMSRSTSLMGRLFKLCILFFFPMFFFVLYRAFFYFLCTVFGCDGGNRTRIIAVYTWRFNGKTFQTLYSKDFGPAVHTVAERSDKYMPHSSDIVQPARIQTGKQTVRDR